MKRFSLRAMLCAIALMLISANASAASGAQNLRKFLSNVRSFQADFTQAQDGKTGAALGPSSGTMTMLRPDRFRWDYLTPYEQLIVSDGNKVWFWDKDLEQITVKPLDFALGATPAVLLSGNAAVDDRYMVSDFKRDGPFDWAELTPLDSEANFEKLWIGFERSVLRVIELRDSFGQTTRIQFSNVRINPQLDPELFVFLPPAGVDVIGE